MIKFLATSFFVLLETSKHFLFQLIDVLNFKLHSSYLTLIFDFEYRCYDPLYLTLGCCFCNSTRAWDNEREDHCLLFAKIIHCAYTREQIKKKEGRKVVSGLVSEQNKL